MRKFTSYKLEAIQQVVAKVVLSLIYIAAVFVTDYIFDPKTNMGRICILLTYTPVYIAAMLVTKKLITMYWNNLRLKDMYYDEDSE